MTKEQLAEYATHKAEADLQKRRISRLRAGEKRKEAQDKLKAAQAKMDAIEAAIEALDDPLERDVLFLRYTTGKNGRLRIWREVALEIYRGEEESHLKAVSRLHDRALASIAG